MIGCSILLVFVFMVILSTSNNSSEQAINKTKAQALQQDLQLGLEQLYWQWQRDGRAEIIDFVHITSNQSAEPQKIPMNLQGQPIVERSKKGCSQLLNWLFDTSNGYINESLNIDFVEHSAHQDDNQAKCYYSVGNNMVSYDFATNKAYVEQ